MRTAGPGPLVMPEPAAFRTAPLAPATPRARKEGKKKERDRGKESFFPSRRSVSLQKGTNQPATRMSLNRSQRSCRSTKYGTQAKT